jgi:hypothetical protein
MKRVAPRVRRQVLQQLDGRLLLRQTELGKQG